MPRSSSWTTTSGTRRLEKRLVRCGLAESTSDARRKVQQGGVRINGEKTCAVGVAVRRRDDYLLQAGKHAAVNVPAEAVSGAGSAGDLRRAGAIFLTRVLTAAVTAAYIRLSERGPAPSGRTMCSPRAHSFRERPSARSPPAAFERA